MTCGIYKLNFNNTKKVYIGQSIDIETRFSKHKSALNRGVAAPKLQAAYNNYGIASLDILAECAISELNIYEKEAIDIFDSVDNGFNTLYEAGNPVLYGETAGQSKYTNEQYIIVLRLLVSINPTLSKREIHEITGVSLYTIRHIAALESHSWLKQVCPKEYTELERIRVEQKYYRGKQYPKLLSPDGKIYEIMYVTKFAKEHGLLQPKVTDLLNGKRNMHKGWVRAA
jgi:group I intron endonuclease